MIPGYVVEIARQAEENRRARRGRRRRAAARVLAIAIPPAIAALAAWLWLAGPTT